MLDKIPTEEELNVMMGENVFKNWCGINNFILKNYNLDILWDRRVKTGAYELKYRRGGKTLCALYPREQGMHVLIVFGKGERDQFESSREEFSGSINNFYDNTQQYHDGKWLYLDIINDEIVRDIEKLLLIKRKPNRKGM